MENGSTCNLGYSLNKEHWYAGDLPLIHYNNSVFYMLPADNCKLRSIITADKPPWAPEIVHIEEPNS
jgi:hypothetical protein